MKYSLRSLMTFSIRDLALITVIVALVLGWWLDRRNSASERTLKKQLAEHLRVVTADLLKTKDELRTLRNASAKKLPTSSAPAPNSPKN